MKEEYNIESLNPRKNPYPKIIKDPMKIIIDNTTNDSSDGQSEDLDSYQAFME